MEIKTVSILGCGWFGLALAKTLVANNYSVKGSTTSEEKFAELEALGIKPYQLNLNEKGDLPIDFFKTDVLFIAVPPRAKTEDASTYPAKLKRIADAAAKSGVKQIVLISSTGIFEEGNFVVNETNIPNPATASAKALHEAEQLFKSYTQFTTTVIRFGGLLGPGRNLARFFAQKSNLANGNAPINLIELQDCIGLCLHLLKTQKFGHTYHGVAPHHPTKSDFYTRLCEVSGMERPDFKDELLEWKQLESINVPQILGYDFIIQDWFKWMDGRPML